MILQTLWERMKHMFLGETALTQTEQEAAGGAVRAAREWMDLFCGKAQWLLDASVQSLQLPCAIAGELARLVTVEMEGRVCTPVETAAVGETREAACSSFAAPFSRNGAADRGGARAAFLQTQLDDVLRSLRTQCEYAIAGGSLIFKPYVEKGRICVDFVRADGYLPTQWNGRGDLTGAVFIEQVSQRDGWYTRLERHTLAEDGYHVQNSAFYSATRGALGGPVPLSAVPQWAGLEPEWTVRCADGSAPDFPLFAVFKMPFANQNDPSSPAGVSAYSRAEALMEQADRQYSRILWEYEGSELAVDASAGAVIVEDGRTRLPRTAQRLFRELGVDKGDGGDLYSVFSPVIRDESLFNGLENLLRRIEFACYLSYGTLSNAQQVEKTAEEIKMSRQRSYSAVCDMQKSLAVAMTQLVEVMNRYATLYRLAPEGEYEVAFSFGDAVTTDTAAEREAMRADCRDGAVAWWEYRMRFYGECEDEARRKAQEAAEATDTSLSVEQPRKNNVLQEEKV